MQSLTIENKINEALKTVRRVLNNVKQPIVASEAMHQYEDKFLLSEQMVNAALGSLRATFGACGFEAWEQLIQWKGSAVTLRVESQTSWKFIKETERWEDTGDRSVTKATGLFRTTVTHTNQTKIVEYHWNVSCNYSIYFFEGSDIEKKIPVTSGSTAETVLTKVKPEERINSPTTSSVREFEFTEFMKYFQFDNGTVTSTFAIDRTHKDCHTPRRNPEINRILSSLQSFSSWCTQILRLFETLQSETADKDANLKHDGASVFTPIIPALLDAKDETLLTSKDVILLQTEHERSLSESLTQLDSFSPKGMITRREMQLYLLFRHFQSIVRIACDSLDYVEDLLHNQLVTAIGKTLGPADMIEYMEFHNRNLFNPAYAPRLFTYDLRRHGYAPEGAVSIERSKGNAVNTVVRAECTAQTGRKMKFNINGSTEVSFTGEHYVHGYVSQRFSNQGTEQLSLSVRARQFSAFIFMAGTIISADKFQPQCALILQNKDELDIPLMLETLPTPKEFRDAIVSLSPEQQRFARAFRAMQLQSTLFAVCLIPIKPQLETLLRIPSGSLTKEIKLTQDIIKIVLDFQIPSDLVTYDGEEEASQQSKLDSVSRNTKAILDMIDGAKQEAIKEQEMKATNAVYGGIADAFEGGELRSCALADTGLGGPPGGGGFGGAPSAPKRRSAAKPMVMMAKMAAPAPCAAAAPCPPPPLPRASTPKQQQQQAQVSPRAQNRPAELVTFDEEKMDYTKIPVLMDQSFEKYDTESYLKPTKIELGHGMTKRSAKNILDTPSSSFLNDDAIKTEKNRAMDLLDALSRSGELTMIDTVLHVIVAATHQFDKSLMETVIQQNINPIEKIENSTVLVASNIHDTEVKNMITDSNFSRLQASCPLLLKQE